MIKNEDYAIISSHLRKMGDFNSKAILDICNFIGKHVHKVSISGRMDVFNITFTFNNRRVVSFSQGDFSNLPSIGSGWVETANWEVSLFGQQGEIEDMKQVSCGRILEKLENEVI